MPRPLCYGCEEERGRLLQRATVGRLSLSAIWSRPAGLPCSSRKSPIHFTLTARCRWTGCGKRWRRRHGLSRGWREW